MKKTKKMKNAENVEKMEKPGKPDKAEKPGKPGKPDKAEKPKKKKKSKKVMGGLGILVLLVILSLGHFGFGGLGDGKGSDESDDSRQQASEPDAAQADPDEVTVTVRESMVLIGDREFSTPEDLKTHLEEIHNDKMIFRLNEENSIQETYEWVVEVFEELQIQLERTEK